MPTFTSIAFDRLLETGATRSMASDPKSVPRPKRDKYKLNRRNSVTAMPTMEKSVSDRKYHWNQISPALYTTPVTTPLPDSPSSFPPSPYIINHKRRGPRLLKSHSVASVSTAEQVPGEVIVNGCVMDGISEVSRVHKDASASAGLVKSPTWKDHVNGFVDEKDDSKNVSDGTVLGDEGCFQEGKVGVEGLLKRVITVSGNGLHEEKVASTESASHVIAENGISKSPMLSPGRDGSEGFVDPLESLSFSSNYEVEDDFGAVNSAKFLTPGAEFFDAWEELSSEGGGLPPHRDFEAELREMRLSLLSEVEKRNEAEDSIINMKMAWEKIREELSRVSIILPSELPLFKVEDPPFSNAVGELCQQIRVARFVSQSIGRGLAKAESQAVLEAQLEAKNFEIARLCDRLNYYEAVNREMSQRNQESVELARRMRQKRKAKKRWVWASISAAVSIGTAALAWAYIPASRGLSSSTTSSLPQAHGNNLGAS
uniref:Uncharacterized protein n=1 Tax=Kalanchoe fedtschenkoi TaxID=63787 RepID=A0A7N1A669_KALFE